MERLSYIARAEGRFAVSGAPGGYDAYLAAEAARRRKGIVLFVAADDQSAQAAADAVVFFAPDLRVLSFPAWDCLPYDRVSPKPDIESERLATLAALATRAKDAEPAIIVTDPQRLRQILALRFSEPVEHRRGPEQRSEIQSLRCARAPSSRPAAAEPDESG